MFKSEYTKCLESLPKHTREWLKNQPIWHTKDLWIFFMFGFLSGFLVGFLAGL
jgi:hypothetical protein